MYKLAEELFPICRSITGNGVRTTLKRLRREIPQLKICEVPSNTRVFDWVIPKEWNITDAYIESKTGGGRIVDFKENNLHVVGYSTPINQIITLSELQKHLYSIKEQPDWIPYVTSYYKERWGFCITETQRRTLTEDSYHAVIDSKLTDGSLTYAELIIPGKSKKEIFLSTYICHPSMANNELSGPVLLTALAKWISEQNKNRNYTYRIIFIPETIGSITYLSKNLAEMKKNIIAGFNISCVGDDKAVSYIPSRNGNTLADRAALNTLKHIAPDFIHYTYLDRGSDERQYNSPGAELPVCCVCRSKYGEYPEYHTSADDMNFISEKGLEESYNIYKTIITSLENNYIYRCIQPCEPQLGPRGLYPTESYKGSADSVKSMMDFLAYADGTHDLIEISDIINVSVSELIETAEKCLKAGVLERTEEKL